MQRYWQIVPALLLSLCAGALATSFHWPALQPYLLVISLLASGLFGFLYDRIVAAVEDRWPENDNTADLVVLGVAVVVVLAFPLLGLWNTAYLFAMFAAAGVFMAVGSKRRYNERRRRAEGRMEEDIRQLIERSQRMGDHDGS